MVVRSVARVFAQMHRVSAEANAVASQSEGTVPLSESDFAAVRHPQKDFYILGSGSSTLSLSDKDWAVISEGVSIGLNSWAFHPFVPNVLSIEDIDSVQLLPQREAMLRGLRLLENRNSNPLILRFRTPSTTPTNLRLSIPHTLLAKTRNYGRFQVPASESPRELRAGIKLSYQLDKFGLIPQSLLIDQGASVVRMIHFALRSGAKRIVLAGVDLIGSPYFFEADPTFLERIGMEPFRRLTAELLHGTIRNRPGSSSIIQFLPELRTIINRDFGAEIFALRPTQAMRSLLPEISL